MNITLPSYIYSKSVGRRNKIHQELITKHDIDCTGRFINKNGFTGYELVNIQDSFDKILVISKKSNSKILEEYEKILLIKTGELLEENFLNNINLYEWYKHPRKTEITINNEYLNAIIKSWKDFKLIEENKDFNISGLRKPQIGALYSILSKYTIDNKTSTIVMPTGTGKTETMLAALLMLQINKLIVIVPSDALREQISKKFIELGIFGQLGMLGLELKKPIVGILKKKPENIDEFTSSVNVIITTINILGGMTDEQQKELASKCSHLFIDEAHHTPAKTWHKFKENFGELNILQFTATPFRNDRKRIEGKIIYNYPLKKAQEEGYFKEIIFRPILEPNESKVDKRIMEEAIKQLREDILNEKDHILMARCKDIDSATKIFNEYYNTRELSEFRPILIHSKTKSLEKNESLERLKKGESKIVVCVDMLGEGYDLPNLKIAALHYAHRSLGITMQFIGRFTRTAGLNLGNATFIANVVDDKFEEGLKEMYSENSDWNKIISRQSNLNIEKQVAFQNFIDGFDNLDVDITSIRAPFSATFFKVRDFNWDLEKVEKCITDNFFKENIKYAINEEDKLIVIIEKNIETPSFGKIKELSEVKYVLHLLCYDDVNNLFYILSDIESRKESIVNTFGGRNKKITDNDVYKAFFGLEQLQLFIVGLKDGNAGNIKYRMYAGVDVKSQLTSIEQINKEKSNIFGFGFENGGAISIGASNKGKIWAKWNGDVSEWKNWCIEIGKKLNNLSANGDNILDWVMNIEKISSIPTDFPISIDWNENVYLNYDRMTFAKDGSSDSIGVEKVNIELFKIVVDGIDSIEDTRDIMQIGEIKFSIYADGLFKVDLKGEIEGEGEYAKMVFTKIGGNNVNVNIGAKVISITDYLNNNSPIIKYNNFYYLEGMYLKKPNYEFVGYNLENIETIDWVASGVNIKKESKIKNGLIRLDSIQNKIIEDLKQKGGYALIFNDDGSGEIADIIGVKFKEEDLSITLELYHCKYSGGAVAGGRIGDLYEVCGQTQRSVRWSNVDNTLKQVLKRGGDNPDRYEEGDINNIQTLKNILKICNKIEREFYIVQPGLSKSQITEEQKRLLEVTENYLKSTFNIKLKVIGSN